MMEGQSLLAEDGAAGPWGRVKEVDILRITH